MSADYLFHLAYGPLLLLLGLLFMLLPPKKINHLYGYRMPRAMINQDTWDEANRYAAKWLVYLSLMVTCLQLIILLVLKPLAAHITAAVLICIAALAVIPITEHHLSKTFDDQGQRIAEDPRA